MSSKSSPELDQTSYDRTVDLYRQRSKDLAARSHGLERYLYQIFGSSLIGSIACAIDPWKKFTIVPNKTALLSSPSPVVRTRDKVTFFGCPRLEHYERGNDQYGYVPNNDTAYPFDYYLTGPVHSIVSSGTTNRGNQPTITGFVRDTTDRTRPIGVRLGEFELFLPMYNSSPFSYSYLYQDNHVQVHVGTGLQDTRSVKLDHGWTEGPEIVCDNATTQALLTGCQTRALAAMSKYALAMMDRCLPEHKTFNLAYQIAELKDLPQTLKGTLQIWIAFERTVGTELFRLLQQSARYWHSPALISKYASMLGRETGYHIDVLLNLDQLASSAYLTFKFGWQSLVQAVEQLLPSPEKVSKEVNRIVDSIGKDISFRSKKTWVEKVTSLPNFTGNLLHNEALDTNPTHPPVSGYRDVELRCMANIHIQFPSVDEPTLRKDLYLRKIGLWPSPSDIFDLIPWTWLIDWFSGIGDYVHLMDTIYHDNSIVNHAFMTYKEVNHVDAHFTGKFVGTRSTNFDGSMSSSTFTQTQHHSGKLLLKYQLRKAMSEVASVKDYWSSSLGSDQKAIIGALLTKYGLGPRRGA
jgi:hypothetical protein